MEKGSKEVVRKKVSKDEGLRYEVRGPGSYETILIVDAWSPGHLILEIQEQVG